jgi:inosine-uridine nucleoside N-ribohydrolase
MTNIALLFKVDPEIPSLLRSLVMMCGSQANTAPSSRIIEWNAICDPHATAIAYNANVGVHRSVGLQITQQVTMPAAEVRQRFSAKLLQPVLDFAAIWFQKQTKITFHDPLSAAVIFDDQICQFERGDVRVELSTEHGQGRTDWSPSESGKHEIAAQVNATNFFSHFFSAFS